MSQIPLAERMRPKTLDDYVGQTHLIGADAPLRKTIDHGRLPSIILWGPPGVGKTTLAHLLARHLKRPFFSLSAINSGVKDVRSTISKAENSGFFDQGAPLLFIDEIHRFSKSQQDSLLGAVERGIITLIGATTENPSFEVISALRSRCQIYVLKPLSIEDQKNIINNALEQDTILQSYDVEILSYRALLRYAGGDARRLLNILDIIVAQNTPEEKVVITDALVETILQDNIAQYDKSGEAHYDTISAFIKSVRGGDPDAAVYYLARMLKGGEDPKFICRRLIILAAEDIGLANPNALLLANTCFETVEKIGLPEGRIPMAQCAIYLAQSAKSNTAYTAINAAMQAVDQYGDLSIPLHLRNAPTQLMRNLGYGKEYIYPHDVADPNTLKNIQYLPDEIAGINFYKPKHNGKESNSK